MKTIGRILLATAVVLSAVCCTPKSKGAYKHVVILGVDGGGAWFSETVSPATRAIFADGACTWTAKTSFPTISAQCWGSMLHGVLPEVHGLTNTIVKEKIYDVDSPYPSILRLAKEADPDAKLASFCNWNPINNGIVESNLGVVEGTGSDPEVAKQVCDYLVENDPTVLFVQFDSVDGAGHSNGYGTPAHLASLTAVDALIKDIYDALDKKGILDDTILFVCSDHGGTPDGHHGGDTFGERMVFMGVHGKTVKKGSQIIDAEVQDIPMIAAYALGLEVPATWTGKIPAGIFPDVK